MSFLLDLTGSVAFIAGLAWLATALGISQDYVLAGAVILLAFGIFTAAGRARAGDPPGAWNRTRNRPVAGPMNGSGAP